MTSRRQMLKFAAAAVALAPFGRRLFAADATKRIPVGLQLYSVRNQAAKDLPGVLKAVSAMGYQGVEFAGYYGYKAADLRKLLDENNLKCCGTHTGLDTLSEKNFAATVEFNKTIGNQFLIVPSLPAGRENSASACKETGKLFTDLAGKAKEFGMRVGYHAHGGDFKKYDGETAWDLIFGNAGPDVVMQLDLGNCLDGGGDPYAELKKFPGRSLTIHIKEHGGTPGAAIGQGDVKWNEIFQICETIGGTQWYIVEHESGTTPLESVKACIDGLKKMGKV